MLNGGVEAGGSGDLETKLLRGRIVDVHGARHQCGGFERRSRRGNAEGKAQDNGDDLRPVLRVHPELLDCKDRCLSQHIVVSLQKTVVTRRLNAKPPRCDPCF
jgi:hypothetical protein